MKHHIGCSGWSYDGWIGPFYPQHLENQYWLSYYSQIFSFVEIDSTFYKIPSKFMVSNWNKRTSQDFKFTVKFPKILTHEYSSKTVMTELEETLSVFMDAMKPLRKKILAFIIQFPPWLKIMEGMDYLRTLENFLDNSFRYAVEVRHSSWFNDMAYHFLKDRNFCLVWSQQDRLVTPPIKTSDFLYLRLIGDRSISEKDFGKIVKDRKNDLINWSNILKDFEKNDTELKMTIVSANNHYAGFGPMTAKIFAEAVNDKEALKDNFPILDYTKPSLIEHSSDFDKSKYEGYESDKKRKTRQSFLSEFFDQ
ncbi:MAG: DUF72 domain-containing protein [Nitrososphaeraceae archaeon]|nr:DUF72 domain-containing protein [Nitrososphaeraceae archaeon]